MKNQKYQYFKFKSTGRLLLSFGYYRYNFETEAVELYGPEENKWRDASFIHHNTLIKYCKEISEEQFKLELL